MILHKKELKGMASLLEIKRYDERHDCFRLSAGSCLEIVRIICSDFQAIRENDLELHMAHPIGRVCGAKRPKCEAERSVSLCLMSQFPR